MGTVLFIYLLGYGLSEESCTEDVPEHLVQLIKLYRPAVLRRVVLQVKNSSHLIFIHNYWTNCFLGKFSPKLLFYSFQRDELS